MTKPNDLTALMKNALVELQSLRAKLKEREEPIAIVGMGCRFPGADDPEAFWRLIESATVAVRALPDGRWDAAAFYAPDPEAPGKTYLRRGAFLDRIDEFDADFFGVSPREALKMDPQQRLLLEVSWEALEDAGVPAERLAGTPVGVYMGVMNNEYVHHRLAEMAGADFDAYVGTGNEASFLAGRISYILGLNGPSMAIATACSSSLVTVHLACQAIRNGECDLALAGGVNLMLSPYTNIALSKMQAVAADGRSKTFDATADGYGRGEGCGVVVLKRLSAATEAGDRILAVLRGSALGHNGASAGLTTPSGAAQEALILSALRNAKVEPAALDYVETHGTGTVLGDPIEVQALARALGDRTSPVYMGALKSNIGHLESAAGIASLIKVVLAMQHGAIPRQPLVTEPNPHIAWSDLPLRVPRETTPWERGARPRIAGISSFGLSGSNAHAIVEEAPERAAAPASTPPVSVLALSAKTPEALAALAARYADHIEANPGDSWSDICHTATAGRDHFEHRLAIVAASKEEALDKLRAAAAGQSARGVFRGAAPHPPKIAFLFTGQGSQYAAMGAGLYDAQPVFRAALDRCDAILRPYLDEPLLDLLRSPKLDRTRYTQPVLFAVEYALAELWRSWGVVPAVVLGHSVGEYVAACQAGVFSLEDGLKLIAERARHMQALPPDGAMAATMTSESDARAAIDGLPDIDIAAVNGPRNTVISGRRDSIDAAIALLQSRRVESTRLTVSHAFHSALMDPMLAAFETVARGVRFQAPRTRLVSNVTGRIATPILLSDPTYWTRHVRQPVRFADGMATLSEQGVTAFIEIGPKPVLLGMGRQCLPDDAGGWLPSLRQGKPDSTTMLSSLAELYCRGAAIAWAQVNPGRKIALPTYPFQRRRYWLDTVRPAEQSAATHTAARPDVVFDYYNALSQAQDGAGQEERFLTFGPLPEIVPGFSWLLTLAYPERYPRFVELSRDAQVAMRDLLFRRVDFAACRRALDFGCGYGSDVLRLAAAHPSVEFTGYTISSEQARIGAAKAARQGLDGRVHILNRDSSRDAFPGELDLAFGFEVAHHVKDKPALFANLGRHLTDGGILALADFISNAEFPIEHAETSSYFITKPEWIALLSANGLELADAIDISPEAANYLHDPDFAAHLADIAKAGLDPNVRSALESYNQLGRLLRKGLASYVLLTARKRTGASAADLERHNTAALARLASYDESAPDRWLYDRGWRPAPLPAAPPTAAATVIGTSDLARELAAVTNPSDRHILYLGALDLTGPADVHAGATALLDLVQRLAKSADTPRLTVVTRAGRPEQAAIAGLAGVIALEHPELHCVTVELDDRAGAREILAELATHAEPHIAYRDGVRHVARLARTATLNAPATLDPEATYLITGGFGALGLQIAAKLARAGARHLALVGRRGAAGRETAIRDLEALGATVQVFAADIADPDAVAAILRDTPRLRGIVHAAGVLDDGALLYQTPDRFAKVLAPKVAGAWNLHRQTRHLPLDFFVCFSSLASLIGSPGQGSYAASNAFLDALAAQRRAEGLPALSINWGPWAGDGMAAGEAGARLESLGVRPIDPALGADLFLRLLAHDRPQLGAAIIDWSRFPAQSPFFAECAHGAAPDHARSEHLELRVKLAAAPTPERRRLLISYLQDEVGRVLGRTTPPAPHQGFMDLGVDSLMSVELRNNVQSALGVALPATLFFKYPTIHDLAGHMSAELDAPVPEPTPVAEAHSEAPDEEVDSEIAEELARLKAVMGS